MPLNQTYQLNHLLIWIVKLSHLPSFSNDDDIIAKVIEGKNEESEDDQDDEESMPPTRSSTNELEDALETLQDLTMFSTRGVEIRSLVMNMENLLVRERIEYLSVITDFFKKRQKKRKASQSHLCQFLLFLSNFSKTQTLDRSNFL